MVRVASEQQRRPFVGRAATVAAGPAARVGCGIWSGPAVPRANTLSLEISTVDKLLECKITELIYFQTKKKLQGITHFK